MADKEPNGRVGRDVLPEPMKFDPKTWLSQIDRLRGDSIFPNGREQPPMQKRDFDFD
jgi:hypothetical protein